MRVGTRALDPHGWLDLDAAYDAEVGYKRQLLATRPGDLLAWLPDTEAAATEVLELVLEHLRTDHSERFADVEPDPNAVHPIDAAARLVQDDLCLHLPVDGELRLAAASVCFPAHWCVRDKIGHTLGDIHAPVAGYEGRLAVSVDRFVKRLRPGNPVWRANWSVNTEPELCQPFAQPEPDPPITAADAGERCWLRVERQTLRRLPRHDSVLFTIRTYQRRLAELAMLPGACAELAATIRELPEAFARYKELDVIGPALLTWLDDRAHV